MSAGANQHDSASALDELCRLYWPPLYAFARYRGTGASEAEDLVQGFLLHVIESETVRHADRLKGTFRSFLIGCFKHYMSDLNTYQRAQKRGGAQRPLSLDTMQVEESLLRDGQPTPETQIEQLVDRQWAYVVMRQALQVLEARHQGPRQESFEILRPCLAMGEEGVTYEDYAAKLGIGVPAVKSAIFRLRREFRDALRAEIAKTVSTAQEVDAEIRHLLSAVAAD